MGSCCVPQAVVEPLELNSGNQRSSALTFPRPKVAEAKNLASTEEDCQKPQELQNLDEEKIQVSVRSDIKKNSSTSVMGQSQGYSASVYSKLNRQEFHEVLIAPSSAKLTILDRMENENFPPEEVFMKYPAGSLINIARNSVNERKVTTTSGTGFQADSAIY